MRVGDQTIGGPAQFIDPDTGLATNVMTPSSVTDQTLTAPADPVAYSDLSKTAFGVAAPEGLQDFAESTDETIARMAPTESWEAISRAVGLPVSEAM